MVVVYRGTATLDVKAPVVRGSERLGFISEVHAGGGVQRVVVELPLASALRRNDRYMPFRFSEGTGFKVIGGSGGALQNGDEVEAGFAGRSEPEPQGFARGERRVGDGAAAPDLPGNGPGPDPRAPFPPWNSVAPDQDLQTGGFRAKNYEQVPSVIRQIPDDIARKARAMPPDQAVEFLSAEIRSLPAKFEEARRTAHERGDHEAAAQIRKLHRQTLSMARRLRMQAAQSPR